MNDRYDVEVLYGDSKQATVLKNPSLKEDHHMKSSDGQSFRFMLTLIVLAALVFLFLYLRAARPAQVKTTVIGGCDESLWQHVYHADRLKIQMRCATLFGTVVDATAGKERDGCRHEADGDGHCWLKLDAGQEKYLNLMNAKHQQRNLVYEPICRYRVTQLDAVETCKDWHQKLSLAKIGSRVKITGAWVLDSEHGHMELHPVTRIEVVR